MPAMHPNPNLHLQKQQVSRSVKLKSTVDVSKFKELR